MEAYNKWPSVSDCCHWSIESMPTAQISTSFPFPGWIVFHCLARPHMFCIHSAVDGHLGVFPCAHCGGHSSMGFCVNACFQLSFGDVCPRIDLWVYFQTLNSIPLVYVSILMLVHTALIAVVLE